MAEEDSMAAEVSAEVSMGAADMVAVVTGKPCLVFLTRSATR
jgi:hypothetical protein